MGGRFKTCPSCGELIGSDETECRFCNASTDGAPLIDSSHITQHPGFTVPPEVHKGTGPVRAASTAIPAALQPCYMASGECIPPEYGPGFDPGKFCWPAFFFADYWFTEKGLVQTGMKHFWVRIITTLIFVFAMTVLIDAGSGSDMDSAVSMGKGLMAGSLLLIWFAGVFGSGAIAYTDALGAYRKYLGLYNRMLAGGTFEAVKANGIRLYWKILLTPFFIFLLFFIIIISSIKND